MTNTDAAIRDLAWGLTIGSGDDSEEVPHQALWEMLGRPPTKEESSKFVKEHARCLQEMAQP